MIKQLVPSDFCLKCLGCCRFSQEDSIWLPTLLDQEKEFAGQDQKIKVVRGEGGVACFYLDSADNKCRIYSRRPLECQLYPFLVNRKDNEVFLAVDLNCPFVEKYSSSKEFKEHLVYLRDFFNQPSQLEILSSNHQILQHYRGAENFFQLKIKT